MVNQDRFSINQLCKLAGVSVRTLHYYDEIGLLKAQREKSNDYRFYTQESILKLQQILFYKELGFSLEQVKSIINQPDFDLVKTLESHHEALERKVKQIQTWLGTIENTIENLKGKKTMTPPEYYKGFTDKEQEEYEKEAATRWDPEVVHESNRRWKSLNKNEKETLMEKGEQITLAIRDAMPKGSSSPEVQQLIGEWQKHIGFFYECTDEILLGLGKTYVEDDRFKAFYDRIDPKLAEFLYKAIKEYCATRGVTE